MQSEDQPGVEEQEAKEPSDSLDSLYSTAKLDRRLAAAERELSDRQEPVPTDSEMLVYFEVEEALGSDGRGGDCAWQSMLSAAPVNTLGIGRARGVVGTVAATGGSHSTAKDRNQSSFPRSSIGLDTVFRSAV